VTRDQIYQRAEQRRLEAELREAILDRRVYMGLAVTGWVLFVITALMVPA